MKPLLTQSALAIVLAVSLAGCSLFRSAPVDPSADMRADSLPAPLVVAPVRSDSDDATAAATRSCSETEMAFALQALPDARLAVQIAERTYYFATNADSLSDADSLAAHAALLKARPMLRLLVAGHTDERGTHDYNLALGERRANAVAKFLISQGVGEGQITATSLGKEKPAVDGHDEAAWAKNRRVELDYRNCAALN